MKTFHLVLRDTRETAGFSSSRAFFNRSGGTAFFGCTYRHYLNIENGKATPSAKQMEKIAIGLSLGARPQDARDLILAYLRVLDTGEELIRLIGTTLAPTSDEIKSRQPALIKSLAKVSDERVYNLTRDQSAFLAAKAENYWTFAVLAHDKGSWSADALSRKTGFDAKAHADALKKLAKLKLLKKTKTGYQCPYAGRLFQHPDKKIFTTGLDALRGYRNDMAKKVGKTLLRYFYFSRGSESALEQYFQYLIEPIKGADVLTGTKPGADSIFFEIETTVKRVLPL